MALFDFYGLGNALVDTEYHVSDQVLAELGVEKGMMTLIDEDALSTLESRLDRDATLVKQASGGSAANTLIKKKLRRVTRSRLKISTGDKAPILLPLFCGFRLSG